MGGAQPTHRAIRLRDEWGTVGIPAHPTLNWSDDQFRMVHLLSYWAAAMYLIGGADEILLEFAVGVGVGADVETARGIDNAVSAVGHAAPEHLSGLAES